MAKLKVSFLTLPLPLTVDLYGSWLPTEAEVLELLPAAKGASTGNKAEELARASA